MRLLSKIFQPVLTIPKNAKIKSTDISCKSQKLLIECGLIRPTSSGLFAILPLARRCLDKLENIIESELDAAGANRMSFPSLVPAALWKASGRLADATELLTLTDRHDKKYLLAPTHEESIADLISDMGTLSYKQLPLVLYQITNKYRDEFRPKHGLLRAREFLMMDAYGLHADQQCAARSYELFTRVYRRIFSRLGLKVDRVVAPGGEMGGSLSHEWHLPAGVGEDVTSHCPAGHVQLAGGGRCADCGEEAAARNSIEVGHTFILGTKYSQPLGAQVSLSSGQNSPCYMSCYGIGVSRLWAAAMEHLCEQGGDRLRHALGIAPFDLILIPPKENSKEWLKHGLSETHELYDMLDRIPRLRGEVVMDDRHHLTIGKRMMMADKMDYPNIVVCGRSILEDPPRYELHTSAREAPIMATKEQLLDILTKDVEEQRMNDVE